MRTRGTRFQLEDEEVLELELVEETVQVMAGSIRNDSGGTCSTMGNFTPNAGASERMDKVALRRALTPGEYSVTFGVDAKRGIATAKAVRPDIANAMPGCRTDDQQLSFHLGGVFREYPDVSPITSSECLVSSREG